MSWAWDFGDGHTSTQQNPTHTYTTGGCFQVTLTITDNHDMTHTLSQCVPDRGYVMRTRRTPAP